MKKNKIHKTNVMRILDREEIDYCMHEYQWDERHLDALTVADKTGKPYHKIYKTLAAVGDKTGVIIACIPSGNELDLKAIAKCSNNKKVEMLPMKKLEETTGYIRGGCSPIGMKKQYPTYIAHDAGSLDTIIVSAGKRGMQVELAPSDLQKMTHAMFGEITM